MDGKELVDDIESSQCQKDMATRELVDCVESSQRREKDAVEPPVKIISTKTPRLADGQLPIEFSIYVLYEPADIIAQRLKFFITRGSLSTYERAKALMEDLLPQLVELPSQFHNLELLARRLSKVAGFMPSRRVYCVRFALRVCPVEDSGEKNIYNCQPTIWWREIYKRNGMMKETKRNDIFPWIVVSVDESKSKKQKCRRRWKRCAICLKRPLYGVEKVGVLPCRHCFHNHCIREWLDNRRASCPMCNYDLCVEWSVVDGQVQEVAGISYAQLQLTDQY